MAQVFLKAMKAKSVMILDGKTGKKLAVASGFSFEEAK
jgi:hypothetical protein